MKDNGKSTQYLAIKYVLNYPLVFYSHLSLTDGRDVALYNLACLWQPTIINVYNFSVFMYFYFILKCMS
jgi:hypothetical protein